MRYIVTRRMLVEADSQDIALIKTKPADARCTDVHVHEVLDSDGTFTEDDQGNWTEVSEQEKRIVP